MASARERAQIWSAEDNIQLHYFSWHQFCSLLCDRFPEANWYDSMDHFQHLKQINSTDNYIDQFETWMQLMTRDNPYLPEYFFVLRFISGQKDNVKRMVKCHKPNTARCIRVLQAHLAAVKRHVLAATQKGARPNQFQQGSRQAPARDN